MKKVSCILALFVLSSLALQGQNLSKNYTDLEEALQTPDSVKALI